MSIERGKQQILFNYLPGRTFDFGRDAVISIVTEVNGPIQQDLDITLILKKIKEQVEEWLPDYRPALPNATLNDEDQFVLIDPKQVQSELYPLVFWCSNKSCKAIIDNQNTGRLPNSSQCPICKRGHLSQLRFVKVHKCGNLEPLRPPYKCKNCESTSGFALDDRGSETISSFRWRCLKCKTHTDFYRGNCRECRWPGGQKSEDIPGEEQSEKKGTDQRMDVEVFRSRRTFYVHTANLINVPHKEYDAFFDFTDWPVIAAAKFFNHSSLKETTVKDFGKRLGSQGGNSGSNINVEDLLKRLNNKEITNDQFVAEAKKMSEKGTPSLDSLAGDLHSSSGLEISELKSAGYALLDSIIPFEISNWKGIGSGENTNVRETANLLGLEDIFLIDHFPIVIASYGYTRTDYQPNATMLKPFPPDKNNNGKFPVFVDKIKADAILFRLNPSRVLQWLRANGISPVLPTGTEQWAVESAYFLRLFNEVRPHEQFGGDTPELRLVTGVLHSVAHLAIRHAALLCGLDKTSISEYIIPESLTFAIYCNNRDGATLGALTSLFDQALTDWLNQMANGRTCVYDPVCYEQGGKCHSCSHLSETSCRLFNHNLSRNYLFGGPDAELNREIVGFFSI